ncbi:unnamed protein product [Cyprideis torosa]|uniref:protoporphyrinogen oxidase n=1 Tax=Cyprideis torosa TaxID=163714 RepID=A0A7R8W453_9CRUS|nr:unnamed protein product [Cyprideis torosa]CAG0879281.1 unnamed protein product [Cyprideis torosa]
MRIHNQPLDKRLMRFRQRFQNESTAIPNEIMGFVEGTGHEFRTAFVEVVEGKAIEELAEITRRIPVIRGHLEAINLKSIEFIHTKEIMNAGLDEIRNKLKVILGQCELEACQKFLRENDLNQLRVVDLENLPDLSNIVDGIEFALSRGILSDGQMAFDALNGIEERVERQVESLRPRLRQKVEQLKQQLEEFSSHLSYIGADLKQAKQVVKMVQQGLDEYGDYGFYVFYAISILILLIVLILLCALLCALCGTPQSRRTGSSLLVIDIYLMLFSPLVILPVVIVLFIGSVPTDRIVCSSLPDFPNTSFTQIVSTIEFTINTREGPIKTDLIRFVRSCHNNASMLDALSLPPGLSPERLEKLPEEVGLRQELEKYTGRISLPGTMRFVPKNAIEDVLALNRSGLFTLNLGPFSRLANQSLVAGDLEALESALNETALEVGKTSPRSTLKYRLFNYAKGIKGQREFLASAEAIAQDISRRANEVDQLSFSFEGDPIAVAIEKRLREVERIREQLTSNNRELSGKVASQFTDTILQNISAHLKSVALELRGGQTRCGSISLAINRTTDVLCKNLLLPYNAVWSGLGFTVLFFIVAVLIALPLSILYSRIKMDPREQSSTNQEPVPPPAPPPVLAPPPPPPPLPPPSSISVSTLAVLPPRRPTSPFTAPDITFLPLTPRSIAIQTSSVTLLCIMSTSLQELMFFPLECFYDAYSESNHHYLPLGKVHHQPSAPPAATYSAADYSPGAYLPRVTAHPTAAPSAPTNTRLLQASDTFGAESNSSAARLIDHETPPVYPGEPALEPQEYERPPPYYFPGPKLGDGQVYELGPRTMRIGPESSLTTLKVIEDLSAHNSIIPILRSDAAVQNNYVLADGKLCQLPNGVKDLFVTKPPFDAPLFRALWHDLWTCAGTGDDESMHDFFKRRFGPRFADYLADPMCRGIFAGDSQEISIKALAKPIFEMERKSGSVCWGFLKSVLIRKEENEEKTAEPLGKYTMTTPKHVLDLDSTRNILMAAKRQGWSRWQMKDGLESLTGALANNLRTQDEKQVKIHLGSEPQRITRDLKTNILTLDIGHSIIQTDHLFAAIPSFCLSDVIQELSPKLAENLKGVPFVDVAVVNLEYPEEIIGKNINGFGYLIPSFEAEAICLGVIFDRSNLPKRRVFTVMMGGAWFRELFGTDPDEEFLLAAARREVETRLDIAGGGPVRSLVSVLRQCIPQYTVGHETRVTTMRQTIADENLPVTLIDHSHDIIRDLSVYPDGCCDDSPLIVEKNVKHKCEDMKPTEEVEKSGRDKEGKNAVVVSEVLVDNGPLDLKHKVDASIAVQVITGPSEKRSKLSYCRTCPKTFSSRKELLKHSATAHADNRGQKICKICNRSCRSQNALVVHMRTHTQDRPFKCAKCEKAFKFVDNYKRHLASHSDDRPYECAKCGVRFKLQESLVKHERNLHAESDDSNLCDLCGKSFPRKTQLY